MNCPRCKTSLGTLTDPDRVITCPGCGTRLVTRAARPKPTPTPAPPLGLSATLPPTPASALAPDPPPPAADAAATAAAPAALDDTLDALLREVRSLRVGQERLLALLERGGVTPRRVQDEDGEEAPAVAPIRAGYRKSVVLIDDDEATRQAAIAQLQLADVPVRAFTDGGSAISGIAEQKPDVIVLELGLDGSLAGKDVINMIKATMEWVDIPIVLWTREPVTNQKEARQVHGADEIVPKAAGAGALVGRVINIFRRG